MNQHDLNNLKQTIICLQYVVDSTDTPDIEDMKMLEQQKQKYKEVTGEEFINNVAS